MTRHFGATMANFAESHIRISHFSLPKTGELANGDAALYRTDEQGRVMLALVDALGHGPEAAKVAKSALERLSGISLDYSMLEVMETLHNHLRGSRGAAATICLVRDGTITACGVGNVELRCAETAIPFIFSPGILGARVQKFRVCETPLRIGSRLVMFSDGISSRLRLEPLRTLPPQEACAAVIEKHRKPEDDATVLVADMG